jgi:hypothetical protein
MRLGPNELSQFIMAYLLYIEEIMPCLRRRYTFRPRKRFISPFLEFAVGEARRLGGLMFWMGRLANKAGSHVESKGTSCCVRP